MHPFSNRIERFILILRFGNSPFMIYLLMRLSCPGSSLRLINGHICDIICVSNVHECRRSTLEYERMKIKSKIQQP